MAARPCRPRSALTRLGPAEGQPRSPATQAKGLRGQSRAARSSALEASRIANARPSKAGPGRHARRWAGHRRDQRGCRLRLGLGQSLLRVRQQEHWGDAACRRSQSVQIDRVFDLVADDARTTRAKGRHWRGWCARRAGTRWQQRTAGSGRGCRRRWPGWPGRPVRHDRTAGRRRGGGSRGQRGSAGAPGNGGAGRSGRDPGSGRTSGHGRA